MVNFRVGSDGGFIPLFLGLLDDIGGIFFGFEELIDVGNVTHVDQDLSNYTHILMICQNIYNTWTEMLLFPTTYRPNI